jgi:hypothetical protein
MSWFRIATRKLHCGALILGKIASPRLAFKVPCAFFAPNTLNGTAAGTGAQVLKLDVRREVSAAAKVICEEEAIDAR